MLPLPRTAKGTIPVNTSLSVRKGKATPSSLPRRLGTGRANRSVRTDHSEMGVAVTCPVETGHSSTSMTNKLVLFFLFTVLTAPLALAQQEPATGEVTLAQ